MRLYLAQHGLAKDESEDVKRPLSERGIKDTGTCAGFLAKSSEQPGPVAVFHSGKLRARQTAEIFAAAWGGMPLEQVPGLAPNDDPAVWSAHLASMREDVMLIGHLPHLQRLVGLLLCRDPERDAVHFQNAGVLCLERETSVWAVHWYVGPLLLSSEIRLPDDRRKQAGEIVIP